MKQPDRCETCIYWFDDRDGPDDPQFRCMCRRHAPHPLPVMPEGSESSWDEDSYFGTVLWPTTDAGDWCGDWRQKGEGQCLST